MYTTTESSPIRIRSDKLARSCWYSVSDVKMSNYLSRDLSAAASLEAEEKVIRNQYNGHSIRTAQESKQNTTRGI